MAHPGIPAAMLLVRALAGEGAAASPASSVAVFPLEARTGVEQATADLVTLRLVEEVRTRSSFSRVVSPQELSLLMPRDEQKQLVRCATDECALVDTELAGGLGVTHMLVGSVGRLGNSFLVALKVMELRTARDVGSVAERFQATSDEVLLDAVRPATVLLLQRSGLLADARASSGMGAAARGLLLGGALCGAGGAVLVGLAAAVGGGTAALATLLSLNWLAGRTGLSVRPLVPGGGTYTLLFRVAQASALATTTGLALSLPLLAVAAGLLAASWAVRE
ncbi:MAG: hypothetical protein AB2A00_18375 [Myxococcota bacterium]